MELLSYISAFVDRFSYFGILFCLVLGSVGFPFPEDAILICSGFFIAEKVLSPAPTAFMVFIGILISDIIIFSLGRHYGRKIVTHKWFGRLLSEKKLAVIEGRFSTYGPWVILIGRQIFGIRGQVLLMAGIMRMPFLRYLLSDVLAVFATMGIMITVGYTGGKAFAGAAHIKDMMPVALVAIIAVALVFVGFVFARNRPGLGTGD
jgi:membrane protein DedA with SNARE-associated domain